MNHEGVCGVPLRFMEGILVCFCCGCYTLPLWTPSCAHKDQPVYEFRDFEDGHHFVFNKNSKLAASINTKGHLLQGKFEIYYDTGILKYWGMLDTQGHVVSGRYNTYKFKLHDYDIRKMTVSGEQNAQTELYDIMCNGISKTDDYSRQADNGIQNKSDSNMTTGTSTMVKKEESLFDCAHSTFRPTVGVVYLHDGKGLRIFQSINGAVMANVDISSSKSIFDNLDIIIETKMSYVDHELLAPGRYEYVGPYTYETVKKQMRTIRRFRQVK